MRALTYDDIQLVPQLSSVATRSLISLETKVSKNWSINIPIIGSPMDTVCEHKMAAKLYELGGVGCIHRFMSIENQCSEILKTRIEIDHLKFSRNLPIMAAIGANGDFYERAHDLIQSGVNILVIDVAHGHHVNVANAISKIKKLTSKVDIIAGNIATVDGAKFLIDAGADGLRVGIGGGSLCTTRKKTGFGIPNVTSIREIAKYLARQSGYIPLMADGGIRNSGDVAKALAVGASCVMLGSLLAGTEESPGQIIESDKGLFKRYRGSASRETKVVHGMESRNVEGESTTVSYKGGVKHVINGILDGVRSSLSYCGANNLMEFHPKYVTVTNAGIMEANPHLLY